MIAHPALLFHSCVTTDLFPVVYVDFGPVTTGTGGGTVAGSLKHFGVRVDGPNVLAARCQAPLESADCWPMAKHLSKDTWGKPKVGIRL